MGGSGGFVQVQGGAPAPPLAGKLHKRCWSCTFAHTRDARKVFDEMCKWPGCCAAGAASYAERALLFLFITKPGQNVVVLDQV
ncbi:hypothetical protein GBA52_003587 [Prunus armeniaca]|nr:hypothetical protein GBA52_003587 [Prunus armeniaca]